MSMKIWSFLVMSLKFFSLTVPVKPKALAGAEMVVRYTLICFPE